MPTWASGSPSSPPVDLGLSPRNDFEPAVQPGQRVVVGLGQLGRDPRPGLGQEHLDPLIVAGEPVVGDRPLMDPCCVTAGTAYGMSLHPRLGELLVKLLGGTGRHRKVAVVIQPCCNSACHRREARPSSGSK